MLRTAAFTVAAVVGLVASNGTTADTVDIATLAGTYLSNLEGGCQLQLRADGTFAMSCRTLPACSGRAITQGDEVGVLCGGRPPSPPFPSVPRYSQPAPGRRGRVVGGVVGGFVETAVGDPNPWIRAAPRGVPGDERLSPTAWPPPAGDPTRGPYVSGWRGPGESFWLQPVSWGGRLYLVRSGEREGFCRAVARGVDPPGDHFLRRGDHLKRRGAGRPAFCSKTRTVERGGGR